MRPIRTRAALVVLTVLLAACDAGGNGAQATLATTGPTVSSPATSSSGVATTSTARPVTTAPDGAIRLSPGGPWRLVDSAPGVTDPGLVYELMPDLWVYLPVEEDIPHGITWVLNEKDRPIIEAYLMAELVYYRSITAHPIELNDPGWTRYYADNGAVYKSDLTDRRQQGQVADLSAGVVLRPFVLGEDRSETTELVYDCILDGGVFRLKDGSLAKGSTLGVAPYGEGWRLELKNSGWQVTAVGTQEDAC